MKIKPIRKQLSSEKKINSKKNTLITDIQKVGILSQRIS